MFNSITTETITAQNSLNQGTMKMFNCRIHQPEALADPKVVQDLLYVPTGCEREFNLAYTYGNVRFENGMDGKTIRWFVNGTEMPSFICESEDEYLAIGNGLASVAASYYGYNGTNPLNDKCLTSNND